MASGKIHRPALPRDDEVKLLGYDPYMRVGNDTISTSNARYYSFKKQLKSGIIFISEPNQYIFGVYGFGSTGSGSISVTELKRITYYDWSVSASGQVITIVPGSNQENVHVTILMWRGDLPTISSTQPS